MGPDGWGEEEEEGDEVGDKEVDEEEDEEEEGDESEGGCESVMVVGRWGVAAGNTVLGVLVQLLL